MSLEYPEILYTLKHTPASTHSSRLTKLIRYTMEPDYVVQVCYDVECWLSEHFGVGQCGVVG